MLSTLKSPLPQEGLFKYVLKHPGDAIDLFLKELHEPSMNRMFYNFLNHKDGGFMLHRICSELHKLSRHWEGATDTVRASNTFCNFVKSTNLLTHLPAGPLRTHLCGMPMNLLGAISQQTHDGDYSTISDISMRYQEVLFQVCQVTS